MTWVVYNGPSAQVDIAETRQLATKGVPIDVDANVASVLLAQAVWDPADPGSGGTVQVLVQGQTLVVTAATLDGGAVTLYSDVGATTAVTLPVTLTTDTTWHLALDTTGTLALAVSWPGGTVLDPVAGTVRNGKALILRPYPTTAQLVAAASIDLSSTYVHQRPVARQAQRWTTSADQTKLMEASTPPPFGPIAAPSGADVVVRTASRMQPFFGVGAALSDSSATILFNRLNQFERTTLLTELFHPSQCNWQFLRIIFGYADFWNTSWYTYDDMAASGQTDPSLAQFSIDVWDTYRLIPVMREILQINPGLKVFADIVNYPKWMTSTPEAANGTLSSSYYSAAAAYCVKAIQSYEAAGVPIWGFSPKNEPNSPQGGTMAASELATFTASYLGPAMRAAKLGSKLFAWDGNWDHYADVATIVDNAAARGYLDGVAWHAYAGEPRHQQYVRGAYPGLLHLMTERRTLFEYNAAAGGPDTWDDTMAITARDCVIGHLRHGGSGTIFWNMALDETGGPSSTQSRRGVVVVDSSTNAVTRFAEYYALRHAGALMQPGAVVVDSTTTQNGVETVAWQNPDGGVALYMYNTGSSSVTFQVVDETSRQATTVTMAAKELTTLAWGPTLESPGGVALTATAPAAPVLTATGGPGGVSLSWTAPASDLPVSAYELYRGTASGVLSKVRDLKATQRMFWDTPASGTYYYAVRARSIAGLGVASTERSAAVTDGIGAKVNYCSTGSIYPNPGGTASTFTLTGVQVGGAQRILLAWVQHSSVGADASDVITAVTWGGVALTKIGYAYSSDSGAGRGISLWMLSDPAPGTGDIVATAQGDCAMAITAVNVKGVDLATPLSSEVADNGQTAATSTSATITGTPRDLVMFASCARSTSAIGAASNATQLSSSQMSINTFGRVQSVAITGGSVTLANTIAAADNFCSLAVRINGSTTSTLI